MLISNCKVLKCLIVASAIGIVLIGCVYQPIEVIPELHSSSPGINTTTTTSSLQDLPITSIEDPVYSTPEYSEPDFTKDTTKTTIKSIGISLPTNTLKTWVDYGEFLKHLFEEVNYEVNLQFAGNDVSKQLSQITSMILDGCDVLVITAIDGESLTDVLALAKDKGIPVIALIRLIMNSDAVTYYAQYKTWKVSELQAEYIIETLDIDNTESSFNIEFFTGDAGDSNLNIYIGSAMSKLKPYLESGKLICPSGQTEYISIATTGMYPEKAQERMTELIVANKYSTNGIRLDAVLCSAHSVSQGVVSAFVNAEYSIKDFPIITGWYSDLQDIENLLAGYLSMIVTFPARLFLEHVAKMVVALLDDEEVLVNDMYTYDNNTGIIPTYICDPVVVTKENYHEILIDNFYYTAEELDALE